MRQAIYILLILLFSVTCIKAHGQNSNDTIVLLLNKQYPEKNDGKTIYNLTDLLATDTLTTNIPDLTITVFSCMPICKGSDIEMTCNDGVISKRIKEYILDCSKDYTGLYIVNFEFIKAINSKGEELLIGPKLIYLKVKK